MQAERVFSTSTSYECAGNVALVPHEYPYLRLVSSDGSGVPTLSALTLSQHTQARERSARKARVSHAGDSQKWKAGGSAYGREVYRYLSNNRFAQPKLETTCSRARAKALLILVVLSAILFAAMAIGDICTSRAVERSVSEVGFTAITVHSGDSLWSLAEAHDIEGLSTAQVVDVIRRQNNLSCAAIEPGAELLVPDNSQLVIEGS